jgi:hypothetical protein
MRNFLFADIFLLGLLLTGCATVSKTGSPVDSRVYVTASDTACQYRLFVQFGTRQMTGILLLRYDGQWNGSAMNEFGIRFFDFSSTADKCTIRHAVSPLNKWFVRKVIEGDFLYLLSPQSRVSQPDRSIHVLTDGTIVLKNDKRHIEYRLNRMNNETAE